ncbi:MAG: PEP-CTERM sorting domain-containing protein [Acidobacteria bacterium]|nr:PEP-CTERM sorting domain-containing protein [Acidobacteriota bacterium]MCL5286466.1 PEP-CTERM sorting domain-containing protein [Acidobacteriota bacterium]
MKRTGTILLCAMILMCAGAAQADPIDPVIIVRSGTGSIDITSPVVSIGFPTSPGCVSSATYTVPGPYFGMGPALTCVFRNVTGTTITSLTFNITTAQLPLNLASSIFSSFVATPTGATAVFTLGAIPSVGFGNPEFAVDLVGFDPNNTAVTMVVNAPEPGTLALLGTGLLGIATRLRKKKA